MNIDQFESVQAIRDSGKLLAADFAEGGDRTLVYGYTVERYTFHVYLLGGMIHRYVTDGPVTVSYSCDTEIEPGAVIPNKRAYPERCDYSFMRAVHGMGEPVS